jgi:hypothetical protein
MFGSYLDLLLRYEFLIFDTYHPDSLYLREQRCDDLWVLFETKRGPRARGVGNTGVKSVVTVPRDIDGRIDFLYSVVFLC